MLSLAGVCVAGVLSYAEAANLIVPCTSSGGCDAVRAHESSKVAGVPVAYFGLAGYLLIALLSIAHALTGDRRLAVARAAMAGFGTAVSAWLTFVALTVIKATCDWCLASAAIMTLLLIVSLLAIREELPEPRPTPWLWLAGAIMLSLGAFGTALNDMNQKVANSVKDVDLKNLKVADLLPPASKMKGNADAKVTIIEFADVNCEACRQIHPTVQQLFDLGQGRLRLGFRHLPLFEKTGHESSVVFAVIADFAATEGKFWDYLETCFEESNAERVKSNDGLLEIASEVGLDMKGVAKAIETDSPTVLDDLGLCDRLGINATPTFIVIAEGQPPRAATASSLADLIQSSPYKELAFPE